MTESLLWSNWGSKQSLSNPHVSGNFPKLFALQAQSFVHQPRAWSKELTLLPLFKHIYTLKLMAGVISLT